jgi:predicted ATP-grasp superfamily ATP-dependent carboligase
MAGPLDTSTPVVVLGVRYGALGVARSLGRLRIPVIGVHDEPAGPALSSRYWRRWLCWDFRVPADQSVEFLLWVGRALDRRALLIPTSDALALLVAECADRLQEAFIFPRVPPDLVRALVNKKDLLRLARRAGVPAPDAVFPVTRRDILDFLPEAAFPLMVKGLDPGKPEGRRNVIVQNPAALHALLAAVPEGAEANLMLQEYIPGREDTVWMFNGYFDRRGQCLTAFTGRKLRQWPPYHGVTALGVCAANPTVDAMTRRFITGIGFHGIIDVGYRYDARDGQYKLLDVNPRLGATFRLFVGANGLDVARACYLDLTGQPVPPAPLVEGRKWLVEEDLISSRQYIADRYLTRGEWLRSLRGVREAAWFALDDPAPFLSWAWHRLARAVRGHAGPAR